MPGYANSKDSGLVGVICVNYLNLCVCNQIISRSNRRGQDIVRRNPVPYSVPILWSFMKLYLCNKVAETGPCLIPVAALLLKTSFPCISILLSLSLREIM